MVALGGLETGGFGFPGGYFFKTRPVVERCYSRSSLAKDPGQDFSLRMLPAHTAPYSKEVQQEATSYKLSDAPYDVDLPDLDSDRLSSLFDRVMEGDARVVPVLKQLVTAHPDFPLLKNYLASVYHVRKQHKKAWEVEREMFRLHPDYPFALLAEAKRHIRAENWEKTRETLGSTLKMRDVLPEGDGFHDSHWSHYYGTVATYYLRTDDVAAAQAILNAFDHYGFTGQQREEIQYGLMAARFSEMRDRMAKNEQKEIRVEVSPIPKAQNDLVDSGFHSPHIPEIFEWDDDFPQELVDEILALDREKTIADLETVLLDEITNYPYYLKTGEDRGWTSIHALMLLSEMKATEATETALAFLSQHPDTLHDLFGDYISWQPFVGVLGEDLPRLAEWMKTPGIGYTGKSYAADAVTRLCLAKPERREATISWFNGLLEFFRDARREDNVLDTRLVTDLVDNLIDLRATESAPFIRQLYEKDLVSELMIGDLPTVLAELESPPQSKAKDRLLPMTRFYQKLMAPVQNSGQNSGQNSLGAGMEEIFGGGVKSLEAPRTAETVGRNDSCPCGSGKKYKKCCMR